MNGIIVWIEDNEEKTYKSQDLVLLLNHSGIHIALSVSSSILCPRYRFSLTNYKPKCLQKSQICFFKIGKLYVL